MKLYRGRVSLKTNIIPGATRLMATSKNVIPAKAGIQNPLTSLDSRLRGSDKLIIIRGSLISCLLLLVFSFGCVSLPASPPGTRPVITQAFISKEMGRYGDVLKIYIEADDPQGFMFRIATSVDQVGYGHYLADWVYLKKPYPHHVIGYLQWNTFSYHASWMPEWTQLTIRVSIFDTNGKESNAVVFPFEFVSQVVPESPLPPPFNQQNLPRLGYIAIDLFNPSQMGDDHDRVFR